MKDGCLLSNETCEKLIEKIHLEYFQYGRQPFNSALSAVIDNLQTICEVYRKFPLTCIQLLEQVQKRVSAQQYREKVLVPILAKYQAAKDQNDSSLNGLYFIAESLECLRKFMGDDEKFLTTTFARDITMLTGCDKQKTYCDVVDKMCRSLITASIEDIRSLTCEPQKNKILTV